MMNKIVSQQLSSLLALAASREGDRFTDFVLVSGKEIFLITFKVK